MLKIAWEYPTHKVEAKPTEGTVARSIRHALTEAEAFRYVAGNDPRPLLVLRECKTCNGTDDALLSKGADNERTALMSKWFHCVKLPVDVLQADHPFYEMFGHGDVEHLFVALPDGSSKVKLQSDTSRTELWAAMGAVLNASYKKDPQPIVKQVRKTFDRLDVLDTRLMELKMKRDDVIESDGTRSSKLDKVDGEIAGVTKEINALKAEIAVVSKIELKNPEGPKNVPGPAKADR
ncbi:MAG TPA: hypothetical protein VM509_08310 [Planctomycetota bacterium]|nr:hypothetical protein [Planctomycetota bacterium]